MLFIVFGFILLDLRSGPENQQCSQYDECSQLAKLNQMYYAETSALEQHGLDELFEYVASIA